MEAKSKSTPVLLALILIVLFVNAVGTFTPVIMSIMEKVKKTETTASDTYYQGLSDLAFDRLMDYDNSIYKDPDVTNINQQQFRALEYIWMELNAQTQMEAEYYKTH